MRQETGSGPRQRQETGSGSRQRQGTGSGFGHQWRVPLVIVTIVLAGGALIAWLQPSQPSGYLDPGNADPSGGRALAAILAHRGEQLTTVNSTAAAKARAGTGAATILVTNPQFLTVAQLGALNQTTADIVLTDPDQAELSAVAPQVTVAGQASTRTIDPSCPLPAATLAGNANMGGTLLATTAPGAVRCYPADGHPSLVSYDASGRRITVLGTGTPFTNAQLGNDGNAALAMNLLGAAPRLIWLEPTPNLAEAAPANGQASFASLIPKPVYMVAVQLIIAVLLLALWRVRRLGPVVAERLPAVVWAAETTEGHGRLYQARRARDQAAQHLRQAAAARISARTGRPVEEVMRTIAGPPPQDDAALVLLADRLDELESQAGGEKGRGQVIAQPEAAVSVRGVDPGEPLSATAVTDSYPGRYVPPGSPSPPGRQGMSAPHSQTTRSSPGDPR